jgi:hypothetical protein
MRKGSKLPPKGERGPSQSETAKHLCMSVTRVHQFEVQGVLVRGATLDENRERYIMHLRARKGGVTDERTRLDAARAEMTELQVLERRRELVPATEGDHIAIGLATLTSGRLQGVGASLGPELAAETTAAGCQALVDGAIHEALRDLADAGSAAVERVEALEGVEPAE